ncbi:MAG: hypothetical protein K2L82_13640 [Lachnospiraceae bacterium]|nr:hypothetical protein [Lachnospiraceae bacterium]
MNNRIDSFYRFLFTVFALYLVALLLCYPTLSLDYASTGLSLWLMKMVPTLLPFMILSGIMIRMNLTEGFVRLLHPFLHCIFGTSKNGSYTIIMGFLCGFPMGARIVGELYESGKLSREEASRLLYFCNNIGPIYFLSYVVPTLAIEKPFIPFLLMYGIPFVYGIVLCRAPLLHRMPVMANKNNAMNHMPAASCHIYGAENMPQSKGTMSLLAAIDASVLSGLLGIAKLGGYMIFFNLLNIVFMPFHHVNTQLLGVYRCILEITSGIDRSGQSLFYPILILLPFGGFSCIAQTYSMIRQTDLSVRPYIFHKVIQTAITAVCYLFIYIL